jgi:hypothetical protein
VRSAQILINFPLLHLCTSERGSSLLCVASSYLGGDSFHAQRFTGVKQPQQPKHTMRKSSSRVTFHLSSFACLLISSQCNLLLRLVSIFHYQRQERVSNGSNAPRAESSADVFNPSQGSPSVQLFLFIFSSGSRVWQI